MLCRVMQVLLVALGGAIGSLARYGAGLGLAAATPWARSPAGTLAVNLLGCLLIGIFARLAESGGAFGSPEARAVLFVGLLGGFTTFSTFGLDFLQLVRGGSAGAALAYAAASVVGGLALTAAGFWLTGRALAS